jgi:hypothetical protein
MLWTQVMVAAKEWRAIPEAEIRRRHDAPFELREYDEFFDTVIEVIDPGRGMLLATMRFPGAVGILMEGEVFGKWTQTGAQSFRIRLAKLSLRRTK